MYNNKYHEEDLSNYSFLVTGGAGFIGSNLIEYLLKYNVKKVRILDNFSNGHMKNIAPFLEDERCELIVGDIRDLKICQQAMEGINYVLHQAALGSVPRSINDPLTSNEVNVNGFLNVLQAAKGEESVRKMVYAASSSTYGDSEILPKREDVIGKPLSPYAVTKYVNELYADVYSKTYNFHTAGLRYFNVFGPRQDPKGAYAAVIPLFMDGALSNKEVMINGDGGQTRDFTFIENVVQANIKAAFSKAESHQVYNVAVGERISINNLWNIIKNATNTKTIIEHRASRVGDVRDSLANIDKAQKELGYQPLFKLKEGLEKALDWYKLNQKK